MVFKVYYGILVPIMGTTEEVEGIKTLQISKT